MRNQQVIRQWGVLRSRARGRGNTLRSLSGEFSVSSRTIRRDLNALQEVGFPILDEVDDESTKALRWRLVGGLDFDGGAR